MPSRSAQRHPASLVRRAQGDEIEDEERGWRPRTRACRATNGSRTGAATEAVRKRPQGRRLTWRVLLFSLILLALVGGAFATIQWYGRSTYFVGFEVTASRSSRDARAASCGSIRCWKRRPTSNGPMFRPTPGTTSRPARSSLARRRPPLRRPAERSRRRAGRRDDHHHPTGHDDERTSDHHHATGDDDHARPMIGASVATPSWACWCWARCSSSAPTCSPLPDDSPIPEHHGPVPRHHRRPAAPGPPRRPSPGAAGRRHAPLHWPACSTGWATCSSSASTRPGPVPTGSPASVDLDDPRRRRVHRHADDRARRPDARALPLHRRLRGHRAAAPAAGRFSGAPSTAAGSGCRSGPSTSSPSEFAKLALAVFFAGYLWEKRAWRSTGRTGRSRCPTPNTSAPCSWPGVRRWWSWCRSATWGRRCSSSRCSWSSSGSPPSGPRTSPWAWRCSPGCGLRLQRLRPRAGAGRRLVRPLGQGPGLPDRAGGLRHGRRRRLGDGAGLGSPTRSRSSRAT